MIGAKGPGVPCPDCLSASRVKNTRVDASRVTLRRRRDCLGCGLRFTTIEAVLDGDTLSADARRAADEIARRYLALGISGRAVVRQLVTALERAAQEGARHEAEAAAAEAPPSPPVPLTAERARP